MNYYKLFELPVSPLVDKTIITKKFIELQKQNHPDFFSAEREYDQENAIELSAQINKAYQTFKNDDKTLEYFLQINQVIEPDEKYNLPPDFLMEMMDLNELIDENQNPLKEIEAFEKAIEAETNSLLSRTDSIIEDKIAMDKLKLYYYKKKYLRRILERLND